jgi:hypothetical protein
MSANLVNEICSMNNAVGGKPLESEYPRRRLAVITLEKPDRRRNDEDGGGRSIATPGW